MNLIQTGPQKTKLTLTIFLAIINGRIWCTSGSTSAQSYPFCDWRCDVPRKSSDQLIGCQERSGSTVIVAFEQPPCDDHEIMVVSKGDGCEECGSLFGKTKKLEQVNLWATMRHRSSHEARPVSRHATMCLLPTTSRSTIRGHEHDTDLECLGQRPFRPPARLRRAQPVLHSFATCARKATPE